MLLFLLGLSTSFAAQSSNSSPARTDYRNFDIIPKKNIFNPRRSPAYVPSERPQTVRRRTESLALVGVMSYGKGPMAFFEGTRSDYRKVLKPNDSIAGFKVTAIEPSSVKLVANTNEIELQLGMQLAREEDGDWKLSVRPESLDNYARATPMRSASQVNSERASESDPNANNPLGAIGNFFANGGFRGGGNGFPGATQIPQAQPAVTPVPSSTQTAPANESADAILQRLAARRAQETGEPQQGQPIEPRSDQRPELSPNQPGQLQPNQQVVPLPDQGAEQPQNSLGEPAPQPPNH